MTNLNIYQTHLYPFTADAAASYAEYRSELEIERKDNIRKLVGSPLAILKTLSPQVRKRVEALRNLQGQPVALKALLSEEKAVLKAGYEKVLESLHTKSERDGLKALFSKEKAVLEAKYEKLHGSLNSKRYEIVNGVVEVKGDNMGTGDEKGVPNFWLTALKSYAKYEEEIYISKRDEEALKFLKDIKWCRVDHPKGFKFDFFFDTNPFFKNSVLTKTCHKRVNMAMAEDVTWTDIEWFPRKCLTKKIVKCNPNKRLISAKPMIRTVNCQSFFSFFKQPPVTELLYHMQAEYEDCEIGSIIRNKIISQAVLWFTGEAKHDEDGNDYDDEDDDDDYAYDYDYEDDNNDDDNGYDYNYDDVDNNDDEYAEYYDGEDEEEEEKPEKKIQVQHRSPVTRGIGVAAAAATGGTATTAVPGGVANQFKPTSLYIGDLNINVTDTQLYQLFNQAGQVISVRICRDFSTRRSLGYGFVNYSNPQDAARAMEMLDFTPVNGKSIRVKRSHRDPNSPKNRTANLFIRNLDKSIDIEALHDTFSSFGHIPSCKIVTDSNGQSKGYGFVQFDNDESAQSAIDKLNGMLINGKQVYVAHALRKEQCMCKGNYSNPQDAARAMEMLDSTPVNGKSIRVKRSHRDPNSPKNRTANLFIRNLDKSIEIEALDDTFSSFGYILSCKIVTDSNGQSKGYGFVQFDNDESAQSAIDKLNGMLINGKQVYVAHALRKEKCMCKGNYSNPQDAARAMEMLDSTPVNGKSIRVKRSHRDPNSPKNRTANLFIRNLDKSIDIEALHDTFSCFGYIPSCKIVTDSNGQSKGYGFVQFDNDESAQSAIDKLNGMLINGKQVYVAHALRKEQCMCKGNYSNPQDAARAMEMLDSTPVNGKSIRVKRSHRDPNSPKNRTANLFIRNLDKSIEIEALDDTFSSFGYILSCKIVTDSNGQSKGYGFVQFDNDESAQSAIDKLNGMLINGKQVYVAHALRKEKCMCKGNYSNPQDAARAMEMLDSTPVNGKSIRVKRSHRDPNSPKNRTANLFIRNLDKSIEIEALHDTFSCFGYIPSCKIVTDSNGQSKGYGFVQFDNDESAQSAIDKLNGMLINGKQVYVAHALRKEQCMCKGNYSNPQDAARAMEMLDSTPVNGKSIRVKRSHRDPNSPKNRTANLFIRNLDKSIEIEALDDTFSSFGYILSCKIVTDSNGQSKGYGFVQFDNDESAQSAIDKLNGMLINGKQVYVAHALRKEKCMCKGNYSNPQDAARAMEMLDSTPVNGKSIRVKRSHRDPNSPKNRTANLFIRNLDKSIEIEALHDTFSCFGYIPSCKIVTDSNGQSKGYGFVQFDNDESAQSAIDKLNGMLINGKQVYVAHALCKEKSGRGTSWGRSMEW